MLTFMLETKPALIQITKGGHAARGGTESTIKNYPTISKGAMGHAFNSFLWAYCPPSSPLPPPAPVYFHENYVCMWFKKVNISTRLLNVKQ